MIKISLQDKEIYQGSLILVNPEFAYRQTAQKLVPVLTAGSKEAQPMQGNPLEEGPVLLKEEAASQLSKLMEEIGAGAQIVPVSGWRSMEQQQLIWDSSLAENGQAFTEAYVAVPGHSEHQTGLAVDLGENRGQIDFIRPSFPYSGICQSFREKAAFYGFVERYPEGMEHITNIGHEPWHFRYVGIPHAAIMERHGLVLEQYIQFLKQYPHGEGCYLYQDNGLEAKVSYLRASGHKDTWLTLSGERGYSVSGNNADGFIITELAGEWRHMDAGTTAL